MGFAERKARTPLVTWKYRPFLQEHQLQNMLSEKLAKVFKPQSPSVFRGNSFNKNADFMLSGTCRYRQIVVSTTRILTSNHVCARIDNLDVDRTGSQPSTTATTATWHSIFVFKLAKQKAVLRKRCQDADAAVAAVSASSFASTAMLQIFGRPPPASPASPWTLRP